MVRRTWSTSTRRRLGEADAAFDAGDRATVQRLMHALRSASAQVGAMEMSTLAGTIEMALRAGGPLQPQWPVQWRSAWSRLESAWGSAKRAAEATSR